MNELVVQDLCLDHNHKTTAAIYKAYPRIRKATKEEYHEMEDIISCGTKPRDVVDDFNKKTGSLMTTKDFANTRKAIKRKAGEIDQKSEDKEEINFAKIINTIKEDDSNDVYIKKSERKDSEDDDKKTEYVECSFIALKTQKYWFDNYYEIINLDATYNICDENCVLYVFQINFLFEKISYKLHLNNFYPEDKNRNENYWDLLDLQLFLLNFFSSLFKK